uniref:Cytochrome c oxidase subunit 2 n=1 Tax=Rena humilis TaxID=711330 RepID=Q6I7Y4_RENHU|nr:cytochrome c oxidase subunit II [Rena humilis]BAD24740.1 cytochrome oxidase subunit 2 [Rena humilis]
MPTPMQLELQDAGSPVMEELIHLHDHVLLITATVSLFVLLTLISVTTMNLTNTTLLGNEAMEMLWTIAPACILAVTALPSLKLLFALDEVHDPHITIKTTGRQWYWNYEYTDNNPPFSFDSYMTPTDQLTNGEFRLLEVDNRMVIPTGLFIRTLVSAEDVLHSWAVPALGVKMDAIPGRLNQTALSTSRNGVFFGQCSELCGANHSFMPIVIESVPLNHFETWSNKQT